MSPSAMAAGQAARPGPRARQDDDGHGQETHENPSIISTKAQEKLPSAGDHLAGGVVHVPG